MSPDASSEEPLLERIAAEILDRQRRGEEPSLEEYCRQYPDHEKELRSFLPALLAVEDLKPGSDDRSGTIGLEQQFRGQRLECIGDYRILREIGRGGMGVVYEAEQQSLSRRVALKILLQQVPGESKSAERFQREARAAARMHHTNIVPVFEVGQENRHLFYAMQLIQGQGLDRVIEDLKQLRREHSSVARDVIRPSPANPPEQSIAASLVSGRFRQENLAAEVASASLGSARGPDLADEETIDHGSCSTASAALPGESEISTAETNRSRFHRSVAQIGIQTAKALAYAHARGIIHRDIKPSNLLLDAGGVVWVTDFGLAKTDEEAMTHTGDILGTMRYMSPERFRGRCDVRADVYSLGLTLYELLVLKPAFESPDRLKLIEMVRQSEPSTPRSIDPRIPRDLETIVLKSIDKDPKRRYQSADELSEDLRRFVDDEPIKARRISLPERLMRWSRRNKGVAALLSAIALLLLTVAAGSALTATYFRQLAEEKDNARQAERRLNFNMAFDRGLEQCDEGRVARGMLWLARALELAPPEETEMRRVILANLNAWRRELHSLQAILPHEQTVLNAAFSPNGQLVLTAGADRTAQLWDVESGRRIGRPMLHDGHVHDAIFSPDGSRILTGNHDHTARLWEAQTCEHIKTFPHQGFVQAVAFSPDGSWFVTGTLGGGTATVWDAESFERIGQPLLHGHTVHDAAISSDGERILTACHDKNVRLWDRDTRQLLATFEHETRVPTADFRRPDCDQIVTGDSDGNVYLWDIAAAIDDYDQKLEVKAGEFVGRPWRHWSGVHRLRVSLDGSRIITASFDNTAGLWYPEERAQAGAAFEHRGGVQGAAFSPDGSLIATACDDNTARLWRPAAGQSVRFVEHEGVVDHEAVYSSDGLYILTKNNEETALVRHAVTGNRICKLRQQGGIHALAASPDGSKLLTGNADGTAKLWDAATGEPSGEPFRHGGATWHVAFSSDGARLLTGATDGTVQLGDVAAGDPIRALEIGGGARVFGVAFSPNGSRIAVASFDKMVRIFDAKMENRLQQLLGHQSRVVAVAFSPDGTLIATGSHDNTARVWDVATGTPVSDPMPHRGPIWYPVTLAFSPDGRTIVTGSDDRTVRIWDVKTTKPIGPALAHDAGVRMATFSSDGSRIHTGTAVGTVRLWDVSISPLEGDVGRITLWVQVATGFELDSDGALNVIDARTWKQRRDRLQALGGPPGG